jgi:hypothetical protein
VSRDVMDLTEFETASGPRGPRCGIRIVMSQLTPGDQAKLEAALARTKDTPAHRRIKNTEIARWLKGKGLSLTCQSVGRHRRKECSCDDRPE